MFSFDYDNRTVTAMYDLNLLNSKHNEFDPVNEDELLIAERWFHGKPHQLQFRGKQEAEFLFLFMTEMDKRGRNKMSPFAHKATCSVRISHMELVSDFSQYASTPQSLAQFIIGYCTHLVSKAA